LNNKFDIIHAQAGIVPCIIGKFLRVKLIIEHKHGLDFTMDKILKMKFFKLYYERLKKYFVDYTFTGCKSDKNILINKFRYNSQKIIVIYNGIEPHSEIPEITENKPLILGNIGRLTYQKAQEVFIDMAKEINFKGIQCKYYLYGIGENYELYKKLIENYNLSDKIFLRGYTDNVYEALNNIDIFVLTSRYEGIPYVILQAMDYAKPIISTNVGGINEIIEDGFNGLLVNNGDVSELTEKVINLIENKKLRTELSKNARYSLLENYTIEKTIQSLEEIYN
jgi:glycosyltransferase involved in cell wall biosynthesis